MNPDSHARNYETDLSFNLMAVLLFVHSCLPKARPYTSMFFSLSHYNPSTGNYGAGSGDFFFLAHCVILFTGLRACFIEYLLEPLAKHWGVVKKKELTRFSEQAWLLCYYSIFWTLGVVSSVSLFGTPLVYGI